MKTKDHFIEWLRDKILQNPQEPPSGTWQEISDAVDLEESWEKIGEDLEINHLWSKIDSRLHLYAQILRFERLGIAFSMIAALGMGLGYVGQQQGFTADWLRKAEYQVQNIPPATHHSNRTVHQDELLKPTVKQDSNTAWKKKKSVSQEAKPSNLALEFSSEAEDLNSAAAQTAGGNGKVGNKNVKVPDQAGVAFAPDRGIDMPKLKSRTYLIDPLRLNLVGKPQSKLQLVRDTNVRIEKDIFGHYPAAYIGGGAAVKMSWLLSNKTLHAMERNSLLRAAPAHHLDWFMLYGVQLSKRWYLQGDAYLKDMVGQEYKEYRNGKYGEVTERLVYQSLALSLSQLRKQVSAGRFSTYSRLSGGFFAGRLENAEEYNQAGTINKNREYTSVHFGMIGGYEYDTFIGERFMLSYGIRSRLDLMNIYAGTEDTPASFRKTRPLSVDFSLALKYILKK